MTCGVVARVWAVNALPALFVWSEFGHVREEDGMALCCCLASGFDSAVGQVDGSN